MHVVLRVLRTIATDSAYIIEVVERLDFTGSWTRHPVRGNDGHYDDDEDDDDDDDLPIAHSGRVFKA